MCDASSGGAKAAPAAPRVPEEFVKADQAAFVEMYVEGANAVEAMRGAARWMRSKSKFTEQASEPVRRGLNFWADTLEANARKLLTARRTYTREED